jgi:hypothetical protein
MQCAYIRISPLASLSRNFPLTINVAADIVFMVAHGVRERVSSKVRVHYVEKNAALKITTEEDLCLDTPQLHRHFCVCCS